MKDRRCPPLLLELIKVIRVYCFASSDQQVAAVFVRSSLPRVVRLRGLQRDSTETKSDKFDCGPLFPGVGEKEGGIFRFVRPSDP